MDEVPLATNSYIHDCHVSSWCVFRCTNADRGSSSGREPCCGDDVEDLPFLLPSKVQDREYDGPIRYEDRDDDTHVNERLYVFLRFGKFWDGRLASRFRRRHCIGRAVLWGSRQMKKTQYRPRERHTCTSKQAPFNEPGMLSRMSKRCQHCKSWLFLKISRKSYSNARRIHDKNVFYGRMHHVNNRRAKRPGGHWGALP